MFKEERDRPLFKWTDLGDVEEGRPNLGPLMPVVVYRLFQYTLRDILIVEQGVEFANRILRRSGWQAGWAFCENLLTPDLDFNAFLSQLQSRLRELNVGVLRVEKADIEKGEFTLTVAEDLDCSGLPMTDEVVCTYDEGFIAGILECYTGKPFNVKEIDCWASGGRTCRFQVLAK